ncbi:MAG TPA: DUF6084 family protein [Verrucomicrobiae bacterium]|jgi:hypothetical protein|nr:DUF6084 family protein [Verrucomicrobiae bacterium]
MPDLSFRVEGAEVAKFSATPQILLKLRVTNADASEAIHSAALRCQVQMEVTRRRYSPQEQEKLIDLFGEPERWSQTLRNLLWTHVNVNVGPFHGSTLIDLPLPCTFDFNVGATKYFYGLSEGDVPLCLMFSGTVFYALEESDFQMAPISWDKETRFPLPVKLWREMMDAFYPNTAWLCLRRDVFERLCDYKARHGIPTWEQAMERMLAAEEKSVEAESQEKEMVRR